MTVIKKGFLLFTVLLFLNNKGIGQDSLKTFVYPNPFDLVAYLEVETPYADTLNFQILNNNGVVIYEHADTLVGQGTRTFEIGQYMQEEEVYLVEVNFDTINQRHKMLKTTSTALVDHQIESNVKIWPNPFNDYINIAAPGPVDECYVLKLTGEVVLKRINPASVNMKELQPGPYLLVISIGNKQYTTKILKQTNP